MLPTDPYDPNMQPLGPADPNDYETRGWGQSAPFPYAPEQGAGVAMPQPGRPPQADLARLVQSDVPGGPQGPSPADSLMAAALQRQAGPDYMPPPASVGTAMHYQRELGQRNRGPRPDPLRAAALIELGKLMAENGRTMKQHHALLEAFHALRSPSAQNPLD